MASIKYTYPESFSIRRYFSRAFSYKSFLIYLSLKWIKIKYEDSYLGLLWVVVNPLMIAVIYALCLGWALNIEKSNFDYFVFIYSGLIIWHFFRDTFLDTADCFLREPNVLKRSNFPRILIPFSVLLVKLVELIVGYAFLLVILACMKQLSMAQLLIVAVVIFNSVLLSAGTGMLFIFFFTRYRDIKHLLRFLMPFLIYLLPVLYDHRRAPGQMQQLFVWNPLARLLIVQKEALFEQFWKIGDLGDITLTSLLIFVAGTVAFIINEHKLIDVI